MRLVLIILSLLVAISEERGGFSSRGSSSRSSSSSRPSYPKQSSRPQSSPQTRPSSSSGGWNRPQSGPTSTNQHAPKAPTYGWQTPPRPTQAPSYGWQKTPQNVPKPTQVPTNNQKVNDKTQQNAGTYGWQTPKPTISPQRQNPVTSAPNWPKPSTQRPISATSVRNWPKPSEIKPSSIPQRPNSAAGKPQTQNPVQNTASYPKQNTNSYNTGTKYEKGYSKGYDQGYQRGVQQSTKINPAYYPPQNNFGYPGQGIHSGYHSPTYSGMSVYGSPNNYGYPVSSAYGYQSYGTGHHDFTQGLVLGAVGGYLLNSALHPTRHVSVWGSSSYSHPISNPWGYSGNGYGSGYQYTKYDHSTTSTTTINNNYFNDGPSKENGGGDSGWIQCVAYDPLTEATMTNPNCTCNVTVTVDPSSNNTIANHHCSSQWGTKVEQTPVKDVEVFNRELATNRVDQPEKLKEMEKERKRNEVYKELNIILNMGSFTA